MDNLAGSSGQLMAISTCVIELREKKPLSRSVVGKTLMVEELGRRKVNAAVSGQLMAISTCVIELREKVI
nr:hypothetical protein [Tanacetum cinerariifolium]